MTTTTWEYEIRGLYFGEWEAVNTETTLAEAKRSLKEYNENEPEYPHKIVRVKA